MAYKNSCFPLHPFGIISLELRVHSITFIPFQICFITSSWNIYHQVKTVCRLKKWLLSLVSFWSYLPWINYKGETRGDLDHSITFNTLWVISIILGRHSRRYVLYKNGCCPVLLVSVISLERTSMRKLCTLHSFHPLWDILIIFVKNIYQVKKVCHMQEWLLFLATCLSYLPWMNLKRGNDVSSIAFIPLVWDILLIFSWVIYQVQCCA